MKNKLLISFSGGRTSAYMTWYLLNEWPDRENWDMVVVFANTGKEVEGTLKFIEMCSISWGIDIIWVEAMCKDENGNTFSEKGYGVKHKIVSYKTASRNGEPFEEVISVLGIPSSKAPYCSRQLKTSAIDSYIKSIGWNDYHKAIGIRADEIDRMNEDFRKLKVIYPFIKYKPLNKKMVLDWWKLQPFDLNIDTDLGNCDACWKKDMKRLVRISKKKPEVLDWWQKMTDKYGHITAGPASQQMKPPFNFYRGNLSPKEIHKLKELSDLQLELFTETEKLDGCSESCEAF